MLERMDLTEVLTVVIIGCLAGGAVFAGQVELAATLGGGLVGYLTKAKVEAKKNP